MEFDDYVRHVTQKYSVAIAIAIIKSKPENISTQEYVEILKNKITDKQMEIEDIDVCSDDFNFDESFRNDDAQMENDANVSVTILNDFEDNSLNILRDVDEEIEAKKAKNTQQIIPSINEPTTSKAYNFLNIETNNTENFVETHKHNTTDSNNDQDQNRNEHSILIDKKLAEVIIKNLNKHNHITDMNPGIENNMYSSNINTEIENIKYSSIQNVNDTEIRMNNQMQSSKTQENSYQNTENVTYSEKDKLVDKITKNINKNNENETYMDTQETIPYTLHGLTQNYTHVSQSQSENIEIEKHFIYGNKEPNKPIQNSHKNTTTISINEGIFSQVIDISNIVKVVENNGRKYVIINGNNSQNEREMNSQVNTQDMLENDTINEPTQLSSVTIEDNMEEEYSQAELVPFKIIEELNKIRSLLNKAADKRPSMDGSLSDSGYRSDSQSRSSYKSALNSSGNWLNQSAYSLFNYLTQCPLVASTEDIVNEIAVVLGKLIDRLHEEEIYPSFLEDILDNTDLLLRDVFEGDSSDDNVLLKKDENIQRIFLLNKSVHILKYTIEQITQKLEILHTNLTKEDNLYELTNVEETENSCYLFHLLDIILKSYIKVKDSTQSSSQTSQDENKMLKKSSITDIWRKKWNPNYKEVGSSENLEKKCVLIKCSEVLNKIIVDCMNGYSLVAFAALQCFNLMQS